MLRQLLFHLTARVPFLYIQIAATNGGKTLLLSANYDSEIVQ